MGDVSDIGDRTMTPYALARKTAKVRRVEAVRLRAAGYSYREIGSALGMSASAVYTSVETALRDWAREPLDAVIALEEERLDALLKAFWPMAMGGDAEAASVVLRCFERRARMLGLDAPKRVDVSAIVVQWAEREGLDPEDVVAAASSLLREAH